MDKNTVTTLQLAVDKDRVADFSPLLTKGFTVKTKVGCSVKELICRHLGLSGEYLEHRVQTIFLNGKAVDNIEETLVGEGATLALSAAMPGLAGATLRRSGAYASLRRQITHKDHSQNPMVKDGKIVLKLFNLVAKDIGSMFLTQGIWISGKDVQRFFRKAPELLERCHAAQIDGIASDVDELFHVEWERRQVFLKLIVRP